MFSSCGEMSRSFFFIVDGEKEKRERKKKGKKKEILETNKKMARARDGRRQRR